MRRSCLALLFSGALFGCSAPPASCSDGVQNGAETDVDCGGGTCSPCAYGKACVAPGDCGSNRCQSLTCVGAVPLKGASGVTFDGAGNYIVTDQISAIVLKITPTAATTILAGAAGVMGSTDGPGADARFMSPRAPVLDAGGNVYVVDLFNSTIRKITPAGVVSTLAGKQFTPGTDDGTGAAARFNTPSGIALDGGGNLYVTDAGQDSAALRKITPAGVVTTIYK